MVSPCSIEAAAEALQQGAVIAYPTEAVYGLGCDPWNPDAVMQLLDLKRRSVEKGLIVVAAALEQVEPLIQPFANDVAARVLPTWPGPVTWLCPVQSKVPRCLTGNHNTIAIRISAHPTVRALCQAFSGPIVSTSANISDHAPARTLAEVTAQFHGEIVTVVDGQCGGEERPSMIRDAATGQIIRQ